MTTGTGGQDIVATVPVPLPDPSAENRQPPDAAEVSALSRGILGVVAPEGGLTELQRILIEALVSAMTGFAPDLTADPVGPDEFARGLAPRYLGFRTRIVQMVILYVLVLQPVPLDVVDRVDRFAEEAGVDEGMLSVAHEFATGSLGLAALDFERNGYASTWKAEDEGTSPPLDPPGRGLGRGRRRSRTGPTMAGPRGPTGRHPRAAGGGLLSGAGLHLPGNPGSAPPFLAQHDWVHVTADYGTTVESELEVFGFIARANDDMRAFSLRPWWCPCSKPPTSPPEPDCSKPTAATCPGPEWPPAWATPCGGAPGAPAASTSSASTGSTRPPSRG